MKLLSTIFLIAASINFSQSNWIPLNSFPQDKALYSIYFTDDDNGWISGEEGTILKLNKELLKWEPQQVPVNLNLRSIAFFNNSAGISAGDNGTILRSENGGSSWIKLAINSSNNINELFIVNSSTVYAVGDNGLLLKSTDTGLTWLKVTVPSVADFKSIFFVNERIGFIGTGFVNPEDPITLLSTTDGGSSWKQQHFELYPARNINAVYFIDSLTGYIGGGAGEQRMLPMMYKTTDGGVSWSNIPIMFEIHDMKFVDSNTGIIAGGEQTYNKFIGLYKNETIENLLYHNEDYDIYSVFVTPSGKAWAAAGGGEILFADIYDKNWKHVYTGSPAWNVPRTINISSDGSQFIGMQWGNFRDPGGLIMKRHSHTHLFSDLSFYNDLNNSDNIPHQLQMLDSSYGFYVSTYGNINKTTNSGLNWGIVNFGNFPAGIFFLDKQTGWTFSNELYKTTNGGETWEPQNFPHGNIISDLVFVNSSVGYACGSDDNINGLVFKTTNSGLDWEQLNLSGLNHLTSMSFINADTGIIVGWGNTKLITHDGGLNWLIESDAKPVYENRYILKKKPLLKSDKRVIYSKSSGVLKETRVVSEFNYLDVVFKKNSIFIASDDGNIYVSTDYGNSWRKDNLGVPVLEVTADSSNEALARTSENVFLYNFQNAVPVELTNFSATVHHQDAVLEWATVTETNNWGFDIERKVKGNWEKIAFVKGNGTTSEYSFYNFTDKNISAFGNISYRLKQIDLNESFSYSSEVTVFFSPAKFTLEQNYPNPFNPSTKIKYNIPEKRHVRVILSDALGREVAELENSIREAGYYEIILNSDNFGLSSGVYFYSITAGNYSSSKKMLLIK